MVLRHQFLDVRQNQNLASRQSGLRDCQTLARAGWQFDDGRITTTAKMPARGLDTPNQI